MEDALVNGDIEECLGDVQVCPECHLKGFKMFRHARICCYCDYSGGGEC